MNHRGVEQESAHVLLYSFCLTLGHSQQHLEFNTGLNAALAGKEPGIGNVEEVMTGNTNTDVANAVWVQGVVDHALVVGVTVLLGVPGS